MLLLIYFVGKSGFDVIRFAFKRLPGQEPLINGQGEPMPEPDYGSEEWKSWKGRRGSSPILEEIPRTYISEIKVKLEDD